MRNISKILLILIIIIGCGEKKKESGEKVNTPPFIKHIEVLPQHPVLGSRINLRIQAGDKEADEITYTVKWFCNGREIGTGIEFYLNEAKKGDRIYAEVTPSDGKLSGETKRTSVITIANTPPKIIGAKLTPDAILTSTGELTVIGEGFDPDGDSLIFFCYWTLNDKEKIPDSSTTLRLKDLRLKKGSLLTAELYAFDKDTVSSPYTLEIRIANSPPILKEGLDSIPYTPDSIYYPLPIIDPDGDPMTFEILESPKGLEIDNTKGIVHGSVEDTTAFEILVRATDIDGAYLDAKFTLTPP